MAYRTYINDVQVFGNNEDYPEWIEYTINFNNGSNWDYCFEKESDILAKTIDTGKLIELNHFAFVPI